MRLRLPALIAVLAVTGACLDPLEVPTGRYGVVTAATFIRNDSSLVLRPQAAFYGNTNLAYSPFTSDTCFVAQYSDSIGVSADLIFLNAGEHIRTSVSSRTDSLFPVPGVQRILYQHPSLTGFPFTPGDTLTVLVPGAIFPTASVSVRTAEPFTHDSIGVPSALADLPLNWTPAPAGGTQMTFSLRYNNGFITTGYNEQIFCSFVDDGSATIPNVFLDGWRNALNNERATRATRVRTREVVIDDRTRLIVISSFARPLFAPNSQNVQ